MDGRVAQSQGMTEFVHRRAHQIRAVIVLLVDQPRLLVVEMSVAPDAWSRVEGVGQHPSWALKRMTIAMIPSNGLRVGE